MIDFGARQLGQAVELESLPHNGYDLELSEPPNNPLTHKSCPPILT